MNYGAIQQAVLDLTARPDKLAATKRLINSRIMRISSQLDAVRDLVEQEEDIAALGTAFTLNLSSFPRFRKFKYMKPTNRGDYVLPIDPSAVFVKTADCSVEQRDRYYIAGNNVRISLRLGANTLAVGYFAYPADLVADADTNWLTEEAYDTIIHGAAAGVFAEIGDDASANMHEGLYRANLIPLVNNHRRS